MLLRRGAAVAAAVLIFLGGIGAGAALDRFGVLGGPTVVTGAAEFDLIRQAWNLLEQEYVGARDLDETQLAHGAIRGMTDAVADTGHTDFMDPEERRQYGDALSGRYVGIGVSLSRDDDRAVIDEVFADGPAARAGLLSGDEILAVDGRPVAEGDTDAVAADVRGPQGTGVVLTIARPGRAPFDTHLTRAAVEIPAVAWTFVPGTLIADIELRRFQTGAADELATALATIREAGATGIILDLRGDPGGYTTEALGVASQFLREGIVYRTENARGEIADFAVDRQRQATDGPLVVLIDGGTASSAEIVAGALKDHRRAMLVGQATFGTGTVVGEYPLADGSALRIGTVNWLTPNGTLIWHEGITPDETVSLPDGVRPVRPDRLRSLDEGELTTLADAQLLRAIEILSTAG